MIFKKPSSKYNVYVVGLSVKGLKLIRSIDIRIEVQNHMDRLNKKRNYTKDFIAWGKNYFMKWHGDDYCTKQ